MIHPYIKTPQNTTISAIIALERFKIGQQELQIAVEQKERAEQRSLDIEEHLKMLNDNREKFSRLVLRTIVYENPHANKALPRDVFVGPFDERWGQEGDLIKQVFVGPELTKLTETEHELGLDQGPFMRHAQKRAAKQAMIKAHVNAMGIVMRFDSMADNLRASSGTLCWTNSSLTTFRVSTSTGSACTSISTLRVAGCVPWSTSLRRRCRWTTQFRF